MLMSFIPTGLVATIVTLGSNAAAAHADPAETLRATIDPLVAPLIDARVAPAAVVAVVKDGETLIAGYGALGKGAAPDADTIFEIGSITKGVTGILLADAIEQGRLRVDQPIDELWPTDGRPPSFEGTSITLRDLATHRSGLPRVPAANSIHLDDAGLVQGLF